MPQSPVFKRKFQVPTWHKIKNVDPTTKRRNLIVKVVNVNLREEGQTVTEVVVGDDTAQMTAVFSDEQLSLAKVGAYLRMQNALIYVFKTHLRVRCDIWSKLAPHEAQDWAVDATCDVSLVEFSEADRERSQKALKKKIAVSSKRDFDIQFSKMASTEVERMETKETYEEPKKSQGLFKSFKKSASPTNK